MSDAPTLAACLNCDQALAPPGRYCPACGQAPAHRLSTSHVLHEVAHVFTHADRGIFGYVPTVLWRPGQLVADYLAGRRKRYFNPFQFLLLAVGAVTLLAKKLGYYDAVGAGVAARMQAGGVPAALLARVSTYFHALGTYFNVWWLLLLPLHALITWLVYRRAARLNYAESVLVQVVAGSAFQLALLLAVPLLLTLTGRQPGAGTAHLQTLLLLLYLSWIGRRALGLRWAGAIGRAALVSLLTTVLDFLLNYAAFNWYVFSRG